MKDVDLEALCHGTVIRLRDTGLIEVLDYRSKRGAGWVTTRDTFRSDKTLQELDWYIVSLGTPEVPKTMAAPPPVTVLQEAEKLIHGDRREAYGPIQDSFNRIAVGWTAIVGADITATQVALMMDWLKTSRFLTSKSRDCLVDKGGYTALAALLEGIDQ